MPGSPLKRPSAGGRLRRLLASLRPPARAGPLPVQTGFPTSLADIVVKNHGRFQNPRRRHRAAAATAPPPHAPAEPVPQQRRELSVAQDAAAPTPAPARPKGAAFRVRPELLAVGGALALALLLIWSKLLVAAATLASVALLWIESASSGASHRRPRPETGEELGLRARVPSIREAESPRTSCAESESDKGSEAADSSDLGCDDLSVAPKRKEKRRRSLRKLLAKKLQNGNKPRDKDSRHGSESKHPGAGEVNAGAGPVQTEPAPAQVTTPPLEAITDDEKGHCRRSGALPLAAFGPIILVGLVAGQVPAVALTVLCAVLSCSVERVQDPVPGSGALVI